MSECIWKLFLHILFSLKSADEEHLESQYQKMYECFKQNNSIIEQYVLLMSFVIRHLYNSMLPVYFQVL
jgi:hypothetical protein